MAKFIISFKTPDAGSMAVEQAITDGVVSAANRNKAMRTVRKFLEYDENICIEIDTEAETATVLRSHT